MKKLISLLLALVLTFSLVGCGNSDDLKAMVGSYELTGLVDPDKGDLSKQLDTLSAFGISITFEIKDDGTAILNTNGQETKLKVDTDKKTISAEGEAIEYTFENDTISFENDGSKMSFKKK